MVRIRDLRKEAKLSQEDLAKKFGLSQQTISSYENNTREPDTEMLKQFAVFFDVSLDYLLGHSDYKNLQEAFHHKAKEDFSLDMSGLPTEAVQQVKEYVEFIKNKYAVKVLSQKS